jgi:deaminated glutathione amidase
MKIAAIQMVSTPDVLRNMTAADALLREAADQGAELAALPEYFCLLGQRDTDKLAHQEVDGDGPLQSFLSQAAKRYGLWIVGGTIPMASNQAQHVRNSCLVYAPDGTHTARYDKMHLFAFDNGTESYNEARVLEPGEHPVCFDVRSRDGHIWRMGLSVCYDLRFGALYQALAADALLVPSAFTYTTGQAHWDVLLRARAIENLAYVIAPAQGGVHENGRRTWGHSMVVDPWGLVLSQRQLGAGVVMAELSKTTLLERRAQLPALLHHRALGTVQHIKV